MDPNAGTPRDEVIIEPVRASAGDRQDPAAGDDGAMARPGNVTEQMGLGSGGGGGSGFDLRGQVAQRPLLAVGIGLVGGMLLGGKTGGGQSKSDRERSSGGDRGSSARRHRPSEYGRGDQPPDPEGSALADRSPRGMSGGSRSSLTSAAQKSGLDETVSRAASSLMGALNERTRSTLSEGLPGFDERLRQRRGETPASAGTAIPAPPRNDSR